MSVAVKMLHCITKLILLFFIIKVLLLLLIFFCIRNIAFANIDDVLELLFVLSLVKFLFCHSLDCLELF